VKRQAVSAVLKTHGLIDVPPQNMVSISVPLGGYLKESHLLPGTHVRKGERIAVIEDQQYIQLQQDYLTAVARLTYSEEEYKRQRELNAGKATSDKAYQQVVADYKAQKVEVKGLSEKLELIGIDPHALTEESLSRNVSISSPIDGYVTRVNANIGKYVRPEDVLFELVNPSDIHLDLKVFEKDIEDVHIGQEVTAYTNNRPDRKYKCEVILVGKDLTEDRALEVHCHFENGDPSLIPGLYMNAEITVSKGDAYVIPSDAVVTHDNKSYVFRVIADNRFERVEVSTGATMDGIVEVEWKGGAPAESDVFVTEGAYALLMTMMNVADE
jgi:cobalt-zinc-cadmium efflux system membrane fusion protein